MPGAIIADKENARKPAALPYVIKMSDGRNTWQIEIPGGEGSPAFEASIPIRIDASNAALPDLPATEADREIIGSKRAVGEKVVAEIDAANAQPPSYLRTLDQVAQLYRQKQFELALVQLVRLERVFPDDLRILKMKGTLLSKVGRRSEARDVWERAMSLDPNDQVLTRALDALIERGR